MLQQRQIEEIFSLCLKINQISNTIIDISERDQSKKIIKQDIEYQLKELEKFKQKIKNMLSSIT